ncbi:MAG: acetyl-CoA carboxylase carboxyltransferase subunit alpha [FCB group bacterium]|nr:acetyl-CoA carboxylase carboxyltransferase subunit alpha [FCB group bacterium]
MSKYILEFEAPLREIEEKIETIKTSGLKTGVDVSSNIRQLEDKLRKKKKTLYAKLSPWDRVQIARHPRRPHTLDFIHLISDDFFELHGDRHYKDDLAIVSGIGSIDGRSVMFVGQQKGKGTKDNVLRNFGMAHPEGYRKALRVMKLADKFKIPIVTMIDTPGAHPGIGAEERGQAEAIARNLMEMVMLGVPIINVVIGEGASGGALGIGVGDRLICFENTWYSVITPEGCASILFRDSSRAKEAAEAMKITAQDLMKMGIADRLIPEPEGGAHQNPEEAAMNLKSVINEEISALQVLDPQELISRRILKLESIGKWSE